MAFHWITHLSGCIAGVLWLIMIGFAVDAARGLMAYRAEQLRKGGGSIRRPLLQTPLPLLLRLLYLACTVFFLLGHTGQTTANWLHVSPRTRQADVVHQAAPGDLHLDGASLYCVIAVGKFGPLDFVFCKFMCYCFFFIKQRTVRTMSPHMNWLEKLVLLATFSVFTIIGIGAWLIQGDRNDLDGTCQMYIQVGFFFTMAGADVSLSAAYLYLFVQPLRETIRLNANHRRGLVAGAGAVVAKPSSTRVAPASLYAVESGAAGPTVAHSQSLALEAVMRRNTNAAAAAIFSGMCHYAFSTTAMTTNEPHMRKLTMPVALLDITVMVSALCFVLRGNPKSAAAASGNAAAVVQIVATRPKDPSALAASAPRSQALAASAPATADCGTSASPTTAFATPETTQARILQEQRRDDPDSLPV